MYPRPLEPLHADHELIGRFERALRIVLEGRLGFELALEDLEVGLHFAELFIVGYHNRREDDGLFATLRDFRRRGRRYSSYQMHEHQEIAELLRECRRSASAPLPDSQARLIHDLRRFVDLLSAHMSLEDTVIYPRIESELSEEDALLVRRNVESIVPHGDATRCHAEILLERFEQIVGVEPSSVQSAEEPGRSV